MWISNFLINNLRILSNWFLYTCLVIKGRKSSEATIVHILMTPSQYWNKELEIICSTYVELYTEEINSNRLKVAWIILCQSLDEKLKYGQIRHNKIMISQYANTGNTRDNTKQWNFIFHLIKEHNIQLSWIMIKKSQINS